MKTIHFLSACLLTLTISCSFAQDKKESKDGETKQIRNVTGFTEISVSEGIELNLKQGDKEFVEVIADADLIDEVLTEKNGNELRVHMKGHNYHNINVTVNVTAIKIDELESGSGANLSTETLIKSDKLGMSVSSGASLNVEFNSPLAKCETSSGSSANLKGEVKDFKVEASSGSTINAYNVMATNVNAEASSGSSVKVHVDGDLKAEASSGSNIEYSGTPKSKDVEKSSGGSVSKD